MADLTADFANVLIEAGRRSAQPIDVDGLKRVILPNGTVTHLTPLAQTEYADVPHRIKQTVTLRDVESFSNYWNLYSDADSRVFADRDGDKLTAVLDYHQSQDDRLHDARWGSHKAVLQLRHTEEWRTWTENSGKQMAQADFAEFIEANAPDIVEPSSAEMLEFASTLEATTGARFEQTTNLHNGQVQLSYREEIKGTYGGEQKKNIHRQFTIRISVYEGQPPIEVTAFVRLRIPGGKLSIWYVLMYVDRRKREAFELVTDQIAKAGISVFNGAAA